MITLFSHFLAEALGCASPGNLHNRVHTALLFRPGHGRSAEVVDAFIQHGSEDESELAFWAELLTLDVDLLRDAARLGRRTASEQRQRRPAIELDWRGPTTGLAPDQPVRVRVGIRPGEHPLPERIERLGPTVLARTTGYTLADLNRAGALERILGLANAHWQEVEQLTGVAAEGIELTLEPA